MVSLLAGLSFFLLKHVRYTVLVGSGSNHGKAAYVSQLQSETQNPYELFNSALEAIEKSQIPRAVALLRAGFFANLYIAPLLLGEEFHVQRIWYAGADGEPLAAREYVARYGRLWQSRPDAGVFLREVWNDASVRSELRGFINLSRNLLAACEAEFDERLRERDLFTNLARLERTQSEILSRLSKANLHVPLPRPRLGLIMLASRDPAASEAFYRGLLGVDPVRVNQVSGGYAEFEFDGIHFAIHGRHKTRASDPYLLGPAPSCLGWGAIFVFHVSDFDRHYDNAVAMNASIVDAELASKGRRYFVTKDPSGYLLEITEENPKGIDEGR